MPKPIEDEIYSRVQAFAAEIVALVQGSVVNLVSAALGEAGGLGTTRGSRAPVRSTSGGRPKGAKRDPKELKALVEKLAGYIKKNPGQRIEQIGAALGKPTKDLALPVKKLIGAKRISTKGERRATKYFPR